MKIKLFLAIALGGFYSLINNLVGGLEMHFTTLFCFMVIDYITGVALALVFKKSPKTNDGSAKSTEYIKGLFKKAAILLYVIVAHKLDILLNIDYVRTAVILSFIVGEVISITENLGLMGVPMPEFIKKALTLLNKKAGENNDSTSN
jgi:toxin secretion/phage lysis holin